LRANESGGQGRGSSAGRWVSADVVARARELSRNQEATQREDSLRWEERVRADERAQIERESNPESYAETAFMAEYNDLDPQPLPGDDSSGDSQWSYGSAAYGEDAVEETQPETELAWDVNPQQWQCAEAGEPPSRPRPTTRPSRSS